MEYFLNAGIMGGIFAVPNSVVDNFIKLANEASLKVLLYALRNNGQNLGAQAISVALNISETQVEEAFVFWENANVFSRTAVTQTTENVSIPVTQPVVQPKAEAKPVKQERQDYNISPSEIAERVNKSEDIKCLFSMSEQIFARPLTHTEQRSLIWMHDYLGLSTEVILMLTTFCVSADKGNIKYIEAVAIDWQKREINTLDLAQTEIKRLEESQGFNSKIMKIFGMNRKPTSKQQEFIDSWKEKNYSLELIEYAYEKTIEAIDKLNFPYLSKILENWYNAGITTREQVDSLKKPQAEQNQKEYSFDMNEFKSLVNNFGD